MAALEIKLFGEFRDLAQVYESLDDEERARAALREAAQKEEILQDTFPVRQPDRRS